MKELRNLFDMIFENDTYELLPRSDRERLISEELERLGLDNETDNILGEALAESEYYGFINGFAYAVRLLAECYI